MGRTLERLQGTGRTSGRLGAQQADAPIPTAPGTPNDFEHFGENAVKGFGRGILSTLEGTDRLARKVPVLGRFFNKVAPVSEEARAKTQALAQPTNSTQRLFKGVEQVAEFLVPGGAAAKAPATASKVARFGNFARNMGVNAAKDAGVRAAQTGGDVGQTAGAGGISALVSTLFGVGGAAAARLPRLLSITSEVPEGAIRQYIKNPVSVKGAQSAVRSGGDDVILSRAQQAARGLRKELSEEFAQSKQAVVDEFTGTRFGLDGKVGRLAGKVADDFGIDLPQNIKNVSLNEGLDLYAAVNELFSKRAVKESAQGISVRNFRDALRNVLVKNSGGKGGGVDKLLSNYAAESEVLEAANAILNSYTKNPVQLASALTRLKAVFNENKGAYLSAIQRLEERTGTNLVDYVAGGQFQNVLPKKIGGFDFGEIVRMLLLPITSPRIVGAGARAAGYAQKAGLTPRLRTITTGFSAQLSGKKQVIDQALQSGESPEDLAREIDSSNAPESVKNQLRQHLYSQ